MNAGTITKRELHLVFAGANDEVGTVVVSMPKEELNQEEVNAVGAALVEKGVIQTAKQGALVRFDRGEVVTTSVARV